MIFVGLDDTDVPGSPGTKRLARNLAVELGTEYRCLLIVRHQLLTDPRIPCTTKNSAAAMLLEPRGSFHLPDLMRRLADWVRAHYVDGSDPGLCLTTRVPAAITQFGRRCQRELVTREHAHQLAGQHDVRLEGLGGTHGGVIGALAAVGLVAGGDDGRVLQVGDWPDDLSGVQDVDAVRRRGIDVRTLHAGVPITEGTIDLGKHLRPSYRSNRVVLFAQPSTDAQRWQAVRLT
jgi:hypothetical protein